MKKLAVDTIKLLLVTAVVFFIPVALGTVTVLSDHCPYGCAESPNNSTEIHRKTYLVSINQDTRLPNWVSYEVDPENFGSSSGRSFRSDPLMGKEHVLENPDYFDARTWEGDRDELWFNLERGHLAPSGAFGGNNFRQELDYMTNIVPMSTDVNRGAWKDLESKIRHVTTFEQSLFIVAGPLFEKDYAPMPGADEIHRVPSGFFKVVGDKTGVVVFVMEQEQAFDVDFCDLTITPSAVNERAGFIVTERKYSATLYTKLGCK